MKRIFIITLMAVISVSAVYASPILETWADGTTRAWEITDDNGNPTPYGSLAWSDAIGRPHALKITGGAYSDQPKEDRIFADSGSSGGAFVGDWSGGGLGYNVIFDFYSDTKVPQRLDVFFLSDDQWAWYYTVFPAVGWSSFSVPLGRGAGWYSEQARDISNIGGDLTDVDQLGVRVYYNYDGGNTDGGLIYGLDNFDLDNAVPEPGTWVMLGFSLISLCYTFRRKLDRMFEFVRIN